MLTCSSVCAHWYLEGQLLPHKQVGPVFSNIRGVVDLKSQSGISLLLQGKPLAELGILSRGRKVMQLRGQRPGPRFKSQLCHTQLPSNSPPGRG